MLRLVLLSIVASPPCLTKNDGFTIEIDPQLPDTGSTTVWMGYLLARAKYREDHKVPLPSSGDIVPSFQEEVYARDYGVRIYLEWKGQNKAWSEPYWETFSEIKTKGFLEPTSGLIYDAPTGPRASNRGIWPLFKAGVTRY